MSIKFELRLKKLVDKISMSKTPVPGFVVGLSGTDSIVAYLLCYEALRKHGLQDKLHGVHYVDNVDGKKTWFEVNIIPWLKDKCPYATITVEVPITWIQGNTEEARWYSLSEKSKNEVNPRWVVGTVNATERALGTYSIQNKSASIWPVATLWKTDILQICEDFGVPEIAIKNSQIPDCICGRDELAAENIALIDDLLQCKADITEHDPALVTKLIAWIRDTKAAYDFKDRTPYLI